MLPSPHHVPASLAMPCYPLKPPAKLSLQCLCTCFSVKYLYASSPTPPAVSVRCQLLREVFTGLPETSCSLSASCPLLCCQPQPQPASDLACLLLFFVLFCFCDYPSSSLEWNCHWRDQIPDSGLLVLQMWGGALIPEVVVLCPHHRPAGGKGHKDTFCQAAALCCRCRTKMVCSAVAEHPWLGYSGHKPQT